MMSTGNNHQQQQQAQQQQQQQFMSGANSSRKPHPCLQCQKSFSSTHQLAQHARVHSGDKPYSCSYCERKFKQLSHVQQHTRLHTGERPYKCAVQECGRSFIQLSNLQQHQKTHSQYSKGDRDNEKRYFCQFCGKGFKGHSSLLTHEGKHKDPNFQAKMKGPKASTTNNTSNVFNGTNNRSNPVGQSSADVLANHRQQQQQQLVQQQQQQQPQQQQQLLLQQQHQQILLPQVAPQAMSSLTAIWPCTVCGTVYASEYGLLAHMEEVKKDPKHQLILGRKISQDRQQNLANISTLIAEYNNQISHSVSSTGTPDVDTGSTPDSDSTDMHLNPDPIGGLIRS